jgi:hypothetical protein
MGELGEERPLGAAVALVERVQGVEVSEEPGQPGDERVAGQAPQPPAGRTRPPRTTPGAAAGTDPFAMDTVRSWPAQSETSPRMQRWKACRWARSYRPGSRRRSKSISRDADSAASARASSAGLQIDQRGAEDPGRGADGCTVQRPCGDQQTDVLRRQE